MEVFKMTVEQIREQRNAVVRKFDELKAPLRAKRALQFAGQGEGLNEAEWEEWDKIDENMNRELAPLDQQLFDLGRI
jgi:hypothetical protein